MKIVVQRSKDSSVVVNDKIVGSIKSGLTLLVGFTHDDTKEKVDKLVNKVLSLRIFDDEKGVMNKSVMDVSGEILSISQFTLYANSKKGNRPSYIEAMKGEEAKNLYNYFNEELSKQIKVSTGIFGENMLVNIKNDGPITIILEN